MTRLQVADYVGTIESVDFKAFKFLLDCGNEKQEIQCDPIELIFLIEPVCDLHPRVHVRGTCRPGTQIIRFKSLEAVAGREMPATVPAVCPGNVVAATTA
jgi:hypothetical protein